MVDISKITIEVDGKIVSIVGNNLSNSLKKKLRKETEKYIISRKVITEPQLNEGVINE